MKTIDELRSLVRDVAVKCPEAWMIVVGPSLVYNHMSKLNQQVSSYAITANVPRVTKGRISGRIRINRDKIERLLVVENTPQEAVEAFTKKYELYMRGEIL